jgi:hypothetical protein
MSAIHKLIAGIKSSLKHRTSRRGYDNIEVFAGEAVEEKSDETELHKLFYDHTGPLIHKWTHYLGIYDKFLQPFRGKSVRLLEIGVSQGGSLSLWRKYLGTEALIFGLDIEPRCAQFDGIDGSVRIGSQADPDFLRSVVKEMGGIDVVIDDGSHIAEHQKTSLEVLFPLLSQGGLYLCEDLHTSYWQNFNGGYGRQGTFIELGKSLIDDMNSDFHDRESWMNDANREILGIHFYNSMLIIEKKSQGRPRHVMVGKRAFHF